MGRGKTLVLKTIFVRDGGVVRERGNTCNSSDGNIVNENYKK